MRLLLLMPTTTYRADDFVAAADKMGVEIVFGSDRCHVLEGQGAVTFSRESLALDFLDPDAAAQAISDFASRKPIDGVVAVDDATTVIAALAAQKLGMRHNPPDAAAASRDKLRLRERFAKGGVRQARFRDFPVTASPADAAREAATNPRFPCVLKPRMLSASRGVIRANDETEFAAAFARIARILADPELKARSGEASATILVESFVPGPEVALEGLLTNGELEVLALFDKPDPLDGPFFEETYYVTPSRHPLALQQAIIAETAKATTALGITEGPVHAELRLATSGPHVLEIAARSIGGLCARTLRFGTGMSLEEVVVRHAVRKPGWPAATAAADKTPAGVLMIPITHTGVFRGVEGLDDARAVPGIAEITITAIEGRELHALPEGNSYLGFMFARAATPEAVESALRAAHAKLRVSIAAGLRQSSP